MAIYAATNIKEHALGYNGGLFVCIGCYLVLLAEAMQPVGYLCVVAVCVCWLFVCVGYLFVLAVCMYWLFVCIGCLCVFAAAMLWPGGQLAILCLWCMVEEWPLQCYQPFIPL